MLQKYMVAPFPKGKLKSWEPPEVGGRKADVQEIEETQGDREFEQVERDRPVSFEDTLSTGSTLLDLAISGRRIRGGGIPGGIMAEVFGEESTGKTAILAEVGASTTSKERKAKGEVVIQDPEGRFDAMYKQIYGLPLKAKNYYRPDTVNEMFKNLNNFKPTNKGIHVFAVDSLTALTTEWELDDKDAYGMRRAKEFSAGLRKCARRMANKNQLLICSNQVRDSDSGPKTTGGRAIRFYSSLRIELKRGFPTWRVERKRKVKSGKEVTLLVGVISEARIVKSSIDAPFRTAPLYIEFDYGIDDVRANLQWYKDMTGGNTYGWDNHTRAQRMDVAIGKVEGDPDDPSTWREAELREIVIDLWEEIQDLFDLERRTKHRR